MALGAIPPLEEVIPRLIIDKYLDGCSLHLRTVFTADTNPVFKLGKKFRGADGVHYSTTIYLSEAEYQVLSNLPGTTIRKQRYSLCSGALDRYENPDLPYAIFELEFMNSPAAAGYLPPRFVAQEITGNSHYTGYAIAQLSKGGLVTSGSPGTR